MSGKVHLIIRATHNLKCSGLYEMPNGKWQHEKLYKEEDV